jgi:hypothetical protein
MTKDETQAAWHWHKFMMQEATRTLQMFGRITKLRRTQLYVARTIPKVILNPRAWRTNKRMCFVQGWLIVLSTKRKYFSLPLFGVYLIFLSFSIILGSLKKNKRMLHYKGGSSVIDILVPSARNTLILRARGHMQEKDTQEKSSMGQGVKTQRQSATRLAYKACFRWFSWEKHGADIRPKMQEWKCN